MRILLIEGSKAKINFPNLALMKLSAYHKQRRDIVRLNRMDNPDKIYMSSPFKRSFSNLSASTSKVDIIHGGYGINSQMLPSEIEFIMPDYDLYKIDYSMGFTSRGCTNKCPFCVVPKFEGAIRNHQAISTFLHQDHDKVILLDNTFTDSPKFKENSRYLINNNIKVNINQGINIRTLTEDKANILNDLKLRSKSFKYTVLYFAWDNLQDEDIIKKGIQRLLDSGFKSSYLTCYVLVNFNSTLEEDLYRCNVLWKEYKILPFIMSYKGKNPLQRWANRRYIKYTPWEDYDPKKTIH